MTAFGATKHLYHFVEDNAILLIQIYNDSAHSATAKVILFDVNETVSSLDRWINNQVSDALYANAPQPMSDLELTPNQFSLVNPSIADSLTGSYGDQWVNYNVTLKVSEVIQNDVFILESFDDSAIAHVNTYMP